VSIVIIDFETFYDKDYSLTKMTTEEYINDPRFEVIGVGIKIDDGESYWCSNNIAQALGSIDWSQHAILCHNTLFDGYILSKKYGIKPGFWFDTLSMARAVHGVDAGGSLAKLAIRYGLGEKGNEIVNALGKNRSDFTAGDLDRYGAYCRNDCDLTHALFNILAAKFPENELKLIDLTIRMFTEESLMVDENLLVERLRDIKNEKSVTLQGLMTSLNVQTEKEVSKILGSGPQFADLLRKFGAIVPMKESPTTGKLTYAFAKTDPGFIELQEDENPFIQQLCAVRLGTKSTMEESRIERFIGIGRRNSGYIPVPLRYYAAHTGRWGGDDKLNLQNLPRKSLLKDSIIAPKGHVLIDADSSQIEARIVAWLSGQNDLVNAFERKEDVYKIMASAIYGKAETEIDSNERFVGKTTILGAGYGMGHTKFGIQLKTFGVEIADEEASRIISVYRQTYPHIPRLWKEANNSLEALRLGKTTAVGQQPQALSVTASGFLLPSGLYLNYPDLQKDSDDQYSYASRRGRIKIYGGKVVENVCQALARCVIGEQMLKIAQRYKVALTVHDAVMAVVKEEEQDEALAYIQECMTWRPSWAQTLPLACEIGVGKSYGEC